MKYDSRPATWEHINKVQTNLVSFVNRLLGRALVHDQSKLHSPEVEAFDEVTPLLAGTTYGSPEYKANLARIRPAIDHHNAVNSHHPEHYENGIDGFDLLDLTEMLCDWKAATERHDDGDIRRSLEINRERFGMGDQLVSILANTIERLDW